MAFNNVRLCCGLSLVAMGVMLAGCSRPDYELAPVKGKVTLEGQPLTSGKVMFAPAAQAGSHKAGKPGFGNIQPDGSFAISTYAENDGAVVAEHTITVINSEPDSPAGKRLLVNRVAAPQRVTVASGQENFFQVDLTREILKKYGMRFD